VVYTGIAVSGFIQKPAVTKKKKKKGRLPRAVRMPLLLDLEGLLHPILLEASQDLLQRSVIRDLFLLIC
jgi:hypothetical protein